MNISLACKLFDRDAAYFIEPLASLNEVNQILVFRDSKGIFIPKVKYITVSKYVNSKLKVIQRLFQMIKTRKPEASLFIGIYEIPHGLIAFLSGKIKKTPSVICLISNPAYAPIRKGIRAWLTYFILKRVAFVTTTGSKSQSYLVKKGLQEDKLIVLPNSINTEYFKQKKLSRKYDLIYLGRLSHEKHPEIFIEIIRNLKKQFTEIKAAIAGDGFEMRHCINKVNDLGLGESIKFVGHLDYEELVDYFNSGKLFVNCSETEGLPRSIVQAMACGTPCISSNVGDIEDLIINGENGFVVTYYAAIDEYVNKITVLLNNEKLYTQFKQKCRKKVEDDYSYSSSVVSWSKIISRLGLQNK